MKHCQMVNTATTLAAKLLLSRLHEHFSHMQLANKAVLTIALPGIEPLRLWHTTSPLQGVIPARRRFHSTFQLNINHWRYCCEKHSCTLYLANVHASSSFCDAAKPTALQHRKSWAADFQHCFIKSLLRWHAIHPIKANQVHASANVLLASRQSLCTAICNELCT